MCFRRTRPLNRGLAFSTYSSPLALEIVRLSHIKVYDATPFLPQQLAEVDKLPREKQENMYRELCAVLDSLREAEDFNPFATAHFFTYKSKGGAYPDPPSSVLV